MARDSEKPNLGADAINLSPRAQARERIAGERAGEIDEWDLHLCCFHCVLRRRRQTGRQWPRTSMLYAAQGSELPIQCRSNLRCLLRKTGLPGRTSAAQRVGQCGTRGARPRWVTPPPGRQAGHHLQCIWNRLPRCLDACVVCRLPSGSGRWQMIVWSSRFVDAGFVLCSLDNSLFGTVFGAGGTPVFAAFEA
jgi:hypothetical protein